MKKTENGKWEWRCTSTVDILIFSILHRKFGQEKSIHDYGKLGHEREKKLLGDASKKHSRPGKRIFSEKADIQ